MKRAMMALLLAGTTAAPAMAQQRVYITGGAAVTSRESGWSPSLATPSAPPAAIVPSFAGGAGVWLSPNVAVEGTLSMTAAQTIAWHYGYLFDETGDKVTQDRDVPLLGVIRIAPMRHRTASIEPLIGGGITFHRGATVTTSDCGHGTVFTACVPVTPPRPDEVNTTADWMMVFGVDVAIHVSPHLSVAPGFRAGFAKRDLFMTGYDHRGPYSGGGYLWSIGVTARYAIGD
jgi:hypothetical protein